MKQAFIVAFILILCRMTTTAQSCLPEGITFSTQAEIDSFQINYPNCTEIEGDVIIQGDNITNVDGLSVLNSFGGRLIIATNPSLTSLTGLENITSIAGDFWINFNNILYNLNGLNALTTIGQSFIIFGNNHLRDLTALDALTSIGGSLEIEDNDLLNSLSGLDNIDASTISSLSIFWNLALSTCEVQSVCDYLANPNGTIEIYANAPGCRSQEEVEAACPPPPCLPEGIHFTTQAQIDNFQANYPGCTQIEGDVVIGDYLCKGDITNLNGLRVVTSIGGSLTISNNTLLNSLTGLNSLTSVVRAFWLYGNNSLSDLTGLEGLTAVGHFLYIYGNDSLTKLEGLENLVSIGGYLEIINNDALSSLMGLENLQSLGDHLWITGNATLTDLTALDKLDAGTITYLSIMGNPLLSNCEAKSICDYLASPNGSINICNNKTGCNNPAEVESACGIPLACLPYGNYYLFTQNDIDNFQASYPNCTDLYGDVTIGSYFVLNDISNLYGLNVVTSIEGTLTIADNHNLINLTGFENLNYIGNGLEILANDNLSSLTGIEALTSLDGYIYISYNSVLNSLIGLDNIDGDSITSLLIRDNYSLSKCDVKSICDYLVSPNGAVDIHQNATGCNSQQEVKAACKSGVNENGIKEIQIAICPNPASSTMTLEIPHTTALKNTLLTIYNLNGQQLIYRHITEPATVIDIGTLTQGMYIVKVTDDKAVQVGKFIKQ
jgi:hypothetical protein